MIPIYMIPILIAATIVAFIVLFIITYIIGSYITGHLRLSSSYMLIHILTVRNYIKSKFSDKKKKWKMPKIKDGVPTKWGWVVHYPENLTLGENTDIGYGTYLQAKNKITIGKNVKIGAHCAIYTENSIDETSCEIIISDNSKIGANTVILPKTGTKLLIIEKNSVIGACSLVKDNIPPNSISFGTPAKVWKYKDNRR